MKKLILAVALGLSFAFLFGVQSRAGGAYVAEDWTGAYVPAQLGRDNVVPGSYVAASWADAYVPQRLQGDSSYKGGHVATNWAEAYVVQKPQNTDRCNFYVRSS